MTDSPTLIGVDPGTGDLHVETLTVGSFARLVLIMDADGFWSWRATASAPGVPSCRHVSRGIHRSREEAIAAGRPVAHQLGTRVAARYLQARSR